MVATRPTAPPAPGSAGRLATRLRRVRRSLIDLEEAVDLASFGSQRESARNLLHYLAFRWFDLRREQARLASWGLSSLGRSESHVLDNLDLVIGWLDPRRDPDAAEPRRSELRGPDWGRRILARNAQGLLGPTRTGRKVRIMVTMPTEAATDYRLVRDLMAEGMDCARINCAHDGPPAWTRMIAHVHRAERAVGRRCRIEMDLPGPKIRTGPMRPGPSVLKVKPQRDAFGRVTAPGHVWLRTERSSAAGTDGPAVAVRGDWLARRRRGERIDLVDARGSRRTLGIEAVTESGCRAEVRRTIYLTTGTRLEATTRVGRSDPVAVDSVPALEQRIRLRLGDPLVVTARPDPGEDARRTRDGRVRRPAHIACTFPEALRHVRRAQSVWFDDGRIGAVVRSANPDRLVLRITHAPEAGAWLAADRGINFPETELDLPPISPDDLECLRFIVRHADLVGFSFVHTASDLERLRAELSRLGRSRAGIVLKVETRRGFEELPEILLAALRQPPVGVMIARGDLAVEVGFERLAEVQEEILWLCEAAHVPAIWATQVLEGLTKTGLPTRAEVTDAAMGERAECVMLNKGPHVIGAVRALDGILRRMQSHQAKKTSMLRHLHIVERFFAERRSVPGRRSAARSGLWIEARAPTVHPSRPAVAATSDRPQIRAKALR